MMSNMDYSIRSAKKEDLDELFSMLVDLVKYEGLFARFKLTRARLEEELFGIDADWYALVAVDFQENLIGFCLYTFANISRAFNLTSMIQIDDLYVSPHHRRKGVAHQLLKYLISIAKSKHITRLNVWCVKDNEVGQSFYKKIGAEKIDFIDVYSIQVDKL